jgi:hypothetical protein
MRDLRAGISMMRSVFSHGIAICAHRKRGLCRKRPRADAVIGNTKPSVPNFICDDGRRTGACNASSDAKSTFRTKMSETIQIQGFSQKRTSRIRRARFFDAKPCAGEKPHLTRPLHEGILHILQAQAGVVAAFGRNVASGVQQTPRLSTDNWEFEPFVVSSQTTAWNFLAPSDLAL